MIGSHPLALICPVHKLVHLLLIQMGLAAAGISIMRSSAKGDHNARNIDVQDVSYVAFQTQANSNVTAKCHFGLAVQTECLRLQHVPAHYVMSTARMWPRSRQQGPYGPRSPPSPTEWRVAPGVPPLLGGGTSVSHPTQQQHHPMYTLHIAAVEFGTKQLCHAGLVQAATGTFTSLYVLSDCTVCHP
jgi:hypothetical protein